MRLRLIGDVVFTTPLVRALRRSYPDAHLAYVVEEAAEPIVRQNPHLDEVIVARRARGMARVTTDIAVARRLRRARFDLALDLHGGPRSAWLTWASGARERVGYAIQGRRWMYTRVVDRPRTLRPRHSVVNQWDLLAAIPGWSGGTPDPERDPVEIALDADADARVAARLAAAGVTGGERLIVVHVSAGNPFRRWPESFFVEAIARLAAAADDRRVVISSGPSDREAAARIGAAARARLAAAASRILDPGEFDLAELRALIARSRLFVGGDTGPLHLTAATATPVVGIYGPTLPARSTPWRSRAAPTESVEPGRSRLPPVRSAHVHPRRFSMPHHDQAGDGRGGGRARPAMSEHLLPRDALERWAALALLGFAAMLQVSIAAADILLAVAVLLWLVLIVRGRERVPVPHMFWPLLAYAGATLVASVFSVDPRVSLVDSKQLVLLVIVPLAYRLLPGRRSLLAVDVIITVGALSAAVGIVQYLILNFDNLGRRPEGALGHYMTYSGLLMLVACVAVARIMFARQNRVWSALVLPALILALVFTFTRSAWIGASVGIGLLFLLRDFRLIALLPVAFGVFLATAPVNLTTRLYSTFSLTDPSNADRVAMMKSGLRIIKDDPLTGVGPDMVIQVYPQYRDKLAVNQRNPHLHNVPLQIAAERGLPALAIWIWFIATLFADFARRRRGAHPSLSNGALAVIVAMLAAGMFEYNFGDSEFLMLFLVLVTLPYAAEHVPHRLEAPRAAAANARL